MASFKELEAGTKEGYRQEEMVEKEFGGAEENEFDETKARRLLRKGRFPTHTCPHLIVPDVVYRSFKQ